MIRHNCVNKLVALHVLKFVFCDSPIDQFVRTEESTVVQYVLSPNLQIQGHPKILRILKFATVPHERMMSNHISWSHRLSACL